MMLSSGQKYEPRGNFEESVNLENFCQCQTFGTGDPPIGPDQVAVEGCYRSRDRGSLTSPADTWDRGLEVASAPGFDPTADVEKCHNP